jgi:Protein of unknown function (DUF3102)
MDDGTAVELALSTLAAEIRDEVEQAEADFQSSVQHAVRAGELLIEAKGQVSHGQWLPWLEANFPYSVRSAQGYMRLAENAEDAQRVAHLGIKGALKQIATQKQIEDGTEPAQQPDRCDRCGHIIKTSQPHECPEARKRLGDAYDALSRAYSDIRRYPRSSEVEACKCIELAEACAHLAGQIGRALAGEPEPDERRQRLDHVQRTIEGIGFPVCDCGSRLTELKGELVCFACSKYQETA